MRSSLSQATGDQRSLTIVWSLRIVSQDTSKVAGQMSAPESNRDLLIHHLVQLDAHTPTTQPFWPDPKVHIIQLMLV